VSKKISKDVLSAKDIAKWDETLDECLFVRVDIGGEYQIEIGNRRYASFTKKADADNYIASLNSATLPIRDAISAQYASAQLVILGSI
jgi:hypothetical protein